MSPAFRRIAAALAGLAVAGASGCGGGRPTGAAPTSTAPISAASTSAAPTPATSGGAGPSTSASDPGDPGGGSPTPTGVAELRVIDSIDIGGGQALGLALTADAAWAHSYDAASLVRIDPRTGRVVARVTVAGAATVLAAGGALWVGAYGPPGAVYRLDPRTGRVLRTVPLGEVCCDLTIGGGLVWAVDPAGAVSGIDPATGRVVRHHTVALARDVHVNAVYAGDALWVSDDNGPLRRLDPRTGRATAYDVGGGVPSGPSATCCGAPPPPPSGRSTRTPARSCARCRWPTRWRSWRSRSTGRRCGSACGTRATSAPYNISLWMVGFSANRGS